GTRRLKLRTRLFQFRVRRTEADWYGDWREIEERNAAEFCERIGYPRRERSKKDTEGAL
ncbi:hypothetical protein U1Q18_023840, partial [Sarracenia purpurea var. burkii]